MQKKIIILTFFLGLGFLTKAQNFVFNGYFEIKDTCPNTISQINRATGWQAAAYTPDYYNSCAPYNSSPSVPKNSRGYQQDCCGGGGYAGIEVFAINPGYIIREYMQIKLTDTLTAGVKYLTSMYVSRANDIDYAIATMGMLFTDTVIDITSSLQGFISANPQVNNNTLLSDTMNWMLVQDTVTATGNEVYLTIGNFAYDSLSDTVKVGGNGMYSGFAYYYIDGVSVYDIQTLGFEQTKNKNVEANVFPNPNNGNFTLQYNLKENVNLEITDINGTLVSAYILPATGKTMQISNEDLLNGIYLYKITNASGHIKTGKIVVMK